MTVTDRTAATDAEFRSRIAPFESAPTPPEVREARVVEEVARAMADVDDVDWDSELTLRIGTRDWYLRYATAAVVAYRAAQDGGAEEAVRLLRDKGYTVTPPADPSLLAALAPQAGDCQRVELRGNPPERRDWCAVHNQSFYGCSL